MQAAPPFRFVLIVPEGPHQANPALLRVAGVPVAVRLLTNALRAGAVDLRIEGHGEVTDSVRSALARDRRFVRARLGGADERVPTALPTIEARADVELPFSLLALLAREEGSVFVPGAPFVAKDRHLGDPRPLWASTPPSDGLLLPVRTEAEALDATRRIFLTLASRSASAVARRLNSPISTAISRLLVETPLSPTMATVGHTMVGIASAFFFAVGDFTSLLIAGLLFELASILDGVDGELARAKLLDSERGAWVDTAGDTIAYLAYVVALPIGYSTFAQSVGRSWAASVPLLGAVLAVASALLVVAMAAYARSRGLGGSMTGVAGHLRASVGIASHRWLCELGRRALFSKLVAAACVIAFITKGHLVYDALFFGTLVAVGAMGGGVFWAGIRVARSEGRLTSRRVRA